MFIYVIKFYGSFIWWINIFLAALSKFYSDQVWLPCNLHVDLKETTRLKIFRKFGFSGKATNYILITCHSVAPLCAINLPRNQNSCHSHIVCKTLCHNYIMFQECHKTHVVPSSWKMLHILPSPFHVSDAVPPSSQVLRARTCCVMSTTCPLSVPSPYRVPHLNCIHMKTRTHTYTQAQTHTISTNQTGIICNRTASTIK